MSAPLHFILCPFGSGGDVFPLLAIGRLLKQRGCDVTVVAMDYFQDAITSAGMEFVSFGSREEYDAWGANPDLWKPGIGTQLVFKLAMKSSKAAFDAISRVRRPESVLIAPGTNFGARLAREVYHHRLITAHLQPISMLSAGDFPVLHTVLAWMRKLPLWLRRALLRTPNIVDFMARKPLRELCAPHGVKPPARLMQWWHSPDGNLALFPASFAAPQADWPPNTFQHGFPLEDLAKEQAMSPELVQFLDAGAKPILFTAGTGNQHASAFFRSAVESVQILGTRAIIATRHAPNVPANLPASVIAQSYVPFSHVLPHCAAMVHHGGIGTMSQALLAGIPQLITPLAHDQPDNATRIKEQGFGDYLLPSKITQQTLASKLSGILSDEAMRERLSVISKDLRQPVDNARLVDWLMTSFSLNRPHS